MIIPGAAQTPDVLMPYTARWQISAYPAGLNCWSAERTEPGGAIRFIVGADPGQLAERLAAAEAES